MVFISFVANNYYVNYNTKFTSWFLTSCTIMDLLMKSYTNKMVSKNQC